MRNLIKILIMAFLSVAVTIILLPFITQPRTDPVSANPSECPKGQEKKNGCKWVQHRVTGHCQWLPEQAVADPWREVPENTCPTQPTFTPFLPVKITWTPIPRPTDTRWPTLTPTCPPDASKTAKPSPVDKSVVQTVPALPVAPGCDVCYQEKRQADALETLAAKP